MRISFCVSSERVVRVRVHTETRDYTPNISYRRSRDTRHFLLARIQPAEAAAAAAHWGDGNQKGNEESRRRRRLSSVKVFTRRRAATP